MTTKLMVAAVLLLGSSAFACPDLSGTFVCMDDGVATEQTVSQAVDAAGVTTFTVVQDGQSEVLVADGKPYTQVSNEDDYTYTTVSVGTCSAEAFNLDVDVAISDKSGTTLGNVKAKAVVSLDAARNLQSVVSDDQGNVQTDVCTRK